MRRYVVAIALLGLLSAPLRAELRITSRMSARAVAGAPAGNDMMSAMVGPMIQQMFGGAEGVEMVVTMHEDGRVRTEYSGAFAGMPLGTVVLMKADGSSVAFDAKAQTWWKLNDPSSTPEVAEMMAQMAPEVTMTSTSESATIAGLKAQRTNMVLRMKIPLPPGAEQLPPEMLAMIPSEMQIDGELWQADVHQNYTKGMVKAMAQGPLAALNFDGMFAKLTGLTLRQVMRVSVLPGYEIETVVSKVVDEDVPDSVFDVPAGFKEIAMPMPNIR